MENVCKHVDMGSVQTGGNQQTPAVPVTTQAMQPTELYELNTRHGRVKLPFFNLYPVDKEAMFSSPDDKETVGAEDNREATLPGIIVEHLLMDEYYYGTPVEV